MNVSSMSKLLLGLVILPAGAMAQMCTTQSHGLSFFGSGYDINQLSQQVVSNCQSSSLTSNYECQSGLQCGDYLQSPYPSGQVSCTTSSNNLNFNQSGAAESIGQIADQVLQQCQANSYTSNSECQNNVSCRDGGSYNPNPYNPAPYNPAPYNPSPYNPQPPYTPPYNPQPPYNPPYGNQQVTCTTNSNGQVFTLSGVDQNSVQYQVLNQCQSSPYSNAYECNQRLICSRNGAIHDRPPVFTPPVIINPPYGSQGGLVCSVRTAYSTYSGSGNDQGQAIAAARDACIRAENNSYSCTQAQASCSGNGMNGGGWSNNPPPIVRGGR